MKTQKQNAGVRSQKSAKAKAKAIAERLEYLRGEIRQERISYGELAELQSLRAHIPATDTELLEAAGVPEDLTQGREGAKAHGKACVHCGEHHTAGAWRAAEILCPAIDNRGRTGATIKTSWGNKTRCGVAAMIDEATGAAELLAACGSALEILGKDDFYCDTAAQIRAAIAKATTPGV